MVRPHRLPTLALPKDVASAGLPGTCQVSQATRHPLEMYLRQLNGEKSRRRLRRLEKRHLGVGSQLEAIDNEEK